MKVLMLGWEFPPFFAGGVGMVCYELTKALARREDVDITYVMPFGPDDTSNSHVKILVANNLVSDVKIKGVNTLLAAYQDEDAYQEKLKNLKSKNNGQKAEGNNTGKLYGKNLLDEVHKFAEKLKMIADHEDFDVIHAHDWTTFPAAMALREKTGKPFVAHIHITEFDKSGGMGANPMIYDVERAGMHAADLVIAISDFVKNNIINRYGVDPAKIRVVHNGGVEMQPARPKELKKADDEKYVLFAGRVTLQKGPEFFVDAARKVLEVEKNVRFILAGSGDQLNMVIDKAAGYGIANNFMFTGFYTRDQAEKLFHMADVFVMPSVSEPFGLVPLEAMWKGTPTIISKQSGCSEIIMNALKVDFWDINEMANKIVSVLRYGVMSKCMSTNGLSEMKNFNWDTPASKCIDVYSEAISRRS